MPFELEKKLYESVKSFVNTSHRIEMCGDQDCRVCAENQKMLKDARDAVREFEDKYGIDDIPF